MKNLVALALALLLSAPAFALPQCVNEGPFLAGEVGTGGAWGGSAADACSKVTMWHNNNGYGLSWVTGVTDTHCNFIYSDSVESSYPVYEACTFDEPQEPTEDVWTNTPMLLQLVLVSFVCFAFMFGYRSGDKL